MSTITVRCECGERLKLDVVWARQQLRWNRLYSFGDHVTDLRAFVMRWLAVRHDWLYVGGELGKTTVTMTCPKCRVKLARATVDPSEPDEPKR